jgi:hypothetical protein
VELTEKQFEILYEATDWHLKFYKTYSNDPPTYAELLRLNHQKITDIIEDDMSEDDITYYLNKMKDNYTNLYNSYNT